MIVSVVAMCGAAIIDSVPSETKVFSGKVGLV